MRCSVGLDQIANHARRKGGSHLMPARYTSAGIVTETENERGS
ncbi:MAG: hypothetical protein AB7P52_07165 [Alphaproteobacteria bacterium]